MAAALASVTAFFLTGSRAHAFGLVLGGQAMLSLFGLRSSPTLG